MSGPLKKPRAVFPLEEYVEEEEEEEMEEDEMIGQSVRIYSTVKYIMVILYYLYIHFPSCLFF